MGLLKVARLTMELLHRIRSYSHATKVARPTLELLLDAKCCSLTVEVAFSTSKVARTKLSCSSHRKLLAHFPHTSSAISATSFNLFHWSSSVIKFPSSVDAKPHCGLRQSWDE